MGRLQLRLGLPYLAERGHCPHIGATLAHNMCTGGGGGLGAGCVHGRTGRGSQGKAGARLPLWPVRATAYQRCDGE